MPTTIILTPDQEEIRSVARRFLEARYPIDRVRALSVTADGHEPADWQAIADLGWTGIAFDEDRGGVGFGMAERCLLLEEMGRVLLPDPYLSSAVLAADAAAAAGTPAADRLLQAIIDGALRATLVAAGDLLGGPVPSAAVFAVANEAEYLLSGPGGLVLDGASVDVLIVAASLPDGVTGLFTVRPGGPGVTGVGVSLVDETRKVADVAFDGAVAERIDNDEADACLNGVLARGAIALAAEMVGGAQRCLEMTLDYMREREQFGQPIGSFQALKHRGADASVSIEAARELVYFAADIIDGGDEADVPLAAAAAKSAASDAYVAVSAEAIQMHGGIGFTDEHDAHLYYKRALVSASMLGTPGAHRERMADLLGV